MVAPALSHKVLLLGGTGEAKQIAQHLINQRVEVIYSIAGLVRTPNLDCEIRAGGFSGNDVDSVTGLVRYIAANDVSLLINATHPYAVNMSSNAQRAARRADIPCWRYLRPEWRIDRQADLYHFYSAEELFSLLEKRKRPFFTIGQGILEYRKSRSKDQHWIIRSALAAEETNGITLIESVGPFSYEEDLRLMKEHRVDALVTKNSGGRAVAGKLQAAIEMGIPIYLMARPKGLSQVSRVFDHVDAICNAISTAVASDE